MGPLWDLDNTLGNINFNYDFGQDTAYLWAQNGQFNNYVRTFAKNLMKHYEFQEVTARVYEKAYGEVQNYLADGGWFKTASEKIYASVMMDRTRWEMYDSSRWLLNSYGMKSSVKFVQFEKYGEWDDTDKTTALGFMRYYLSNRAEALKESIGKVTAEKPPENTTGSTVSTGTTATTVTSNTTTGTAASAPLYSRDCTPSLPGCGGAKVGKPVLFGGGAIAMVIGAAAGTKSAKKKKDE